MKDIKGYRLIVNLSASQTRRRLKGQGCGVRKVYSDGKNQALIIHTATGGHRQQLYALLHDVIAQAPETEEEAKLPPDEAQLSEDRAEDTGGTP